MIETARERIDPDWIGDGNRILIPPRNIKKQPRRNLKNFIFAVQTTASLE